MEESRALPVGRSPRAVSVSRAGGDRAAFTFTCLWWVLIVMEPDWFLARTIGGPFYRIPLLLLPGLLWVIFRFANWRCVNWPFAAFLGLHVLAFLYAVNTGYVLGTVKTLLYIFATSIAVAALAKTPARLVTLLRIYLLGFIWYGLQGLPQGLVSWHPLMANEDSYGPFMVIGLGFAYNLAAGSRSRGWRLLGYATALLCCLGVVRSFARGAVLAFVAVLGLIWLRSHHKVRAILAGVVAAIVTLVAIEVFFPEGEFWAEMKTISEGTEAGTGQTRWVSWMMAVELFEDSPILGVGAENFGPTAWLTIPFDASRPQWDDPSQLYNLALHNVYFQILCEEGLVGVILFAWLTVDHFRRLRRLRSPRALAIWRHCGGEVDLRSISYALELGMVGFLANAVFYNQLYIHWFWTLIALSFAATRLVEVNRASLGTAPPGARSRRRPAPAL